MSSWHSKPLPRLLEELDARPGGLSQHQAEERLRRTGPNELEPPPQAGLLGRLLEQMRDPMILVLLGAAGLSLAASGGKEWLDAAIILVIVAVNSVISIFQEDRAQHALEELRRLSAPQATVLRGGRPVKLPAAQLVPGDVILLEAGDLVPADARILECSRIQADESAMTGESIPVEKAPAEALAEGAPLGDWTNMVISGTLITAGRGTALVCATGMDTQMGHIAGLLLGDEGTDTPLQQKMGEISRTLSFLCLSVCAVMFGVGLIQGKRMLDMFLTAVSLAVAAIPEGLPAIVTIVLALGVGRMAARGAIVKKLPAVETLGCAGVICSDKTGTLTQNRMTVQEVWIPAGGRRRDALLAGALCNDARLEWRGPRYPRGTPPRGRWWWPPPGRGWTGTSWTSSGPDRRSSPLIPAGSSCPPSTRGRRGASGCSSRVRRTFCWNAAQPALRGFSPPGSGRGSSGPTRRWPGGLCGCWGWPAGIWPSCLPPWSPGPLRAG